jgi:thiol:disulfide interchange protein
LALSASESTGQTLQPLVKNANSAAEHHQNQASQTEQPTQSAVQSPAQPYKLTSRFHLQQGSNHGYLVVRMEMPAGSYIYSMTQTAPLRPSKIDVAHSRQFRLKGTFTPDQPPTVIEKDPIFEQRLEKHKGTVQFFVPIEVAPGTTPEKLTAEVTFSGQVCSDQGVCLPLSDVASKGKFAGFFSPTPQPPATATDATSARPQRTASQSDAANRGLIR